MTDWPLKNVFVFQFLHACTAPSHDVLPCPLTWCVIWQQLWRHFRLKQWWGATIKNIWATGVGEELICQHEDGSRANLFAVVVIRGQAIVGHVPKKIASVCSLYLCWVWHIHIISLCYSCIDHYITWYDIIQDHEIDNSMSWVFCKSIDAEWLKKYSIDNSLHRGASIVCQVTGSRRFSGDLVQEGFEIPCVLILKEMLTIWHIFLLA